MTGSAPYYRGDLALVHDLGFGFHADRCAPGILALLQPVLQRRGLVLELGCGTGLLTRYLVDAGHRVIATDASPAMLNRARQAVPEVKELRQLVLPDDPLPRADAVVAIGHVPSSATRTAAGAATTSGTTTSSSTPRRSWGCSEATASTWSLGPHSASRSSLPDS
jgi:SAM-dependent methyltransferase